MVRLAVRGGGLAPSALTVSKCENFDPLKNLKQCFWTKKYIFFGTHQKNAVSEGGQGEGSTLTVSLAVKYPFFYDTPKLQ